MAFAVAEMLTLPAVGAKGTLVATLSAPRVGSSHPHHGVWGPEHAVAIPLIWGATHLSIRVRVIPIASERAQRHVREAALHRFNIHGVVNQSARDM